MSAKQRPTGVTILAILALLGGLLDLFSAFGLFSLATMGSVATALGATAAQAVPLAAYGMILGVIVLVIGILSLAFAFGAWTLKGWGWTLGIVVEVISILFALLYAVLSGDIVSGLIGQIIGRDFGGHHLLPVPPQREAGVRQSVIASKKCLPDLARFGRHLILQYLRQLLHPVFRWGKLCQNRDVLERKSRFLPDYGHKVGRLLASFAKSVILAKVLYWNSDIIASNLLNL